MDPLSAAASITAVLGLAASVAQGLYTLASRMGSAGEEVQTYSGEVSDLRACLKHVANIVSKHPARTASHTDLIRDVAELCQRILQPFGELQKTLNRYLSKYQARKDSSKIKGFLAKIKWVFKLKEEVLFYRDALSAQQRTLQTLLLLLQSPTVSDEVATDASNIEADLEVAVEELKTGIEPSPPRLATVMSVNSPQGLLTNVTSVSTATAALSISRVRAETSTGPDSVVDSYSAMSAILIANHERHEQSKNGEDDIEDTLEDLAFLSKAELIDIDTKIQDTIDPAGHFALTRIEVVEDTRSTTRRTIRRAEEALNSIWIANPQEDAEEQESLAPSVTSPSEFDVGPPAMLIVVTAECSTRSPPMLPKDRLKTYDDFITAVRDMEHKIPEDLRYLSPGNHYVVLESGLIIVPAMWQYVLPQTSFKKVFVALRRDLEAIAGEVDKEGERPDNPLLTYISRRLPHRKVEVKAITEDGETT